MAKFVDGSIEMTPTWSSSLTLDELVEQELESGGFQRPLEDIEDVFQQAVENCFHGGQESYDVSMNLRVLCGLLAQFALDRLHHIPPQ